MIVVGVVVLAVVVVVLKQKKMSQLRNSRFINCIKKFHFLVNTSLLIIAAIITCALSIFDNVKRSQLQSILDFLKKGEQF